jgi:DNA-directed RNA polymerase subunit RPC12/RpoP
MLYCPRCNNTHWKRVAAKGAADRLLRLRLKRQYRCLKCDKVLTASIFADFEWHMFRSRPRRSAEPRCPACGNSSRRSRRQLLERLFPFWRAYRCNECSRRFRAFQLF